MATALTANTKVQGVLIRRSIVDGYTLVVSGLVGPATRAYRFLVRNRAGGGPENALQTTLYSPAGAVLGVADNPDGNGTHTISVALPNGTYKLNVGTTQRAAFPRYSVVAAQP